MIRRNANSSIDLAVVVNKADGTPQDLTGATLTGWAESAGTKVDGDITPVDLATGQFDLSFTAGKLTVGRWRVKARAVIGTESQVVYEREALITSSLA